MKFNKSFLIYSSSNFITSTGQPSAASLIASSLLEKSAPSLTSDTSSTSKVLEDGAETIEKESLSQLAARQQKFINNLENALIRIKNSTYGICKVTGKLIPKERLKAVPHTMLSIEAKLNEKK